MTYTLENEELKIVVNRYGAELNMLLNKRNNIDYLWNRDPKGWRYQTPILFPIVGKVVDCKYKVNSAIYELPQHGLARLSDFEIIDENKNSIKLELAYSKDTLKIYPFKFKLECEYILENNEVEVKYIVTNVDDKEILFSIGSHPAFMCPREDSESIEDYYLEFNEKENAYITFLTKDGYLTREKRLYLDNSNIIELKKDTFKDDALIFNNLNSNKISLKSKNSASSVTIDFTGFPYLGIWSPKNGSNLICIEPWFGHADLYDFNDDFSKKEGVIALHEGKSFECSYKIIIS